jgi:hypothetical protein
MLQYTYIACLVLNFMTVVNDVPGNMMQNSKVYSEAGIIPVLSTTAV